MARRERVLRSARFDERLRTYWLLSTLLGLALSVVGVLLLPVWLVLGPRVHRRQYESLSCDLTERSLHLRRGFLFRVEKTVPLDKIQDVAMKEGPILRHLGLSALVIETAGQSAQGGGDAQLVGVVDAPGFRDAILDQRDAVVAAGSGTPPAPPAAPPAPASAAAGDVDTALLREIRDTLRRIEVLLARRGGGSSA